MHLYNAEMVNRPKIIMLMAFAATAVSVAVKAIYKDLPDLGGPPSATALFGIFLYIYDRYVWRLVPGMPHLYGSWIGTVTIEEKKKAPIELPCLTNIEQRWLRMSISFYTPHTFSTSSSATLRPPASGRYDFRYEYHVEPREGHRLEDMRRHDGVARLNFEDAAREKVLVGNFFNDREFQASGEYKMTLEPKFIDPADWLAKLDDAI